MKKTNIVLIGFMGCGKTSVGKKVGHKTGYKFIDTDVYIENSEKMAVSEIFAQKGETHFRRLEKELCLSLSEKSGHVIATGGGIIKSAENAENLKKNGIIVYLKASPHHINKNLFKDNSRPLLSGGNKKEKIKILMFERQLLYESTADITISVSNKSKEKIAENIIKEVRKFDKNMRNTRPKP
ncbi:MAG: shikimate kinase [Firmicutes bacterium]|nr:shikimate kinase [Bacillota bacterium]